MNYSSPSKLVPKPFAFNSSPVAATSTFPDFNSSIALAIFVFASSLKLGFSFGIPTPFSLIPKMCSPLVNLPSLISFKIFVTATSIFLTAEVKIADQLFHVL